MNNTTATPGEGAQGAEAEALDAAIHAFDNDLDVESASFDSEPESDDEELAVPYHDNEDDEAQT